MKFQTEGIGSVWWIEVFDTHADESVIQEITDYIAIFEQKYSRFINTSLISRLNRDKQLSGFPKELFGMLMYCQSISELTDYRFNVCSGVIQSSNGYDEIYSFSEKPRASSDSILHGVRTLNEDRIELAPDVMIDLGGIGKGWLIDSLKLILLNHGYKYFSINGGGDIYATSNFDEPITFYMGSPFDDSEYIGTVQLKDAAFACSSPTRRAWTTREGNDFHHLVNARTGESANEYKAVFTYGANGLAVDTASTCLFISPEEEWKGISSALEVEYMTIYADSTAVQSAGFPGNLV